MVPTTFMIWGILLWGILSWGGVAAGRQQAEGQAGQAEGQAGPSLGERAKEVWQKIPDSVKAKAKEKLVEIIEKSFGGVRPMPPPPPPPTTPKEKAAAEKARKAELAKLRKLEKQRKAEAAKAERAARTTAKKTSPTTAAQSKTSDKETEASRAGAVVVQPQSPRPAVEDLREVTVPLERRGSSYYVGARLNQRVEVTYLYDTGASLTTIDSDTLARLGLKVPEHAPTIRTQTANGVVEVPILVLDSIEVGGARVQGGFTVSLCDSCSDGRKRGLLGLNFSRRYLTTIDETKGELRLVPRVDALDHRFDIEPFLAYADVKGTVQGGVCKVTGRVRNRAPRPIQSMRVAAVLVDKDDKDVGRIRGTVEPVPAGGEQKFELHGRAPSFAKFYLELEGADW